MNKTNGYKSFLTEEAFVGSEDFINQDVSESDLIEYIKMLDSSEYENVMALLEDYDEDVFCELDLDESARHFKKRKNVVNREKKQDKSAKRRQKLKSRKAWKKNKHKSSTKRNRKKYSKAVKKSGGKRGVGGKIVRSHR